MSDVDKPGSSVQVCFNCLEETRCRHRAFSAQTWRQLIEWSEIKAVSEQKPMCEACYRDVRDVLIERSAQGGQRVSIGAEIAI